MIVPCTQDVNGDGTADMIIGAHQADPSGSMSGEAYVIFGVVDWTASAVDLAALGAGGLTFEGSARRAYLGHRVAGAGGICLPSIPVEPTFFGRCSGQCLEETPPCC